MRSAQCRHKLPPCHESLGCDPVPGATRGISPGWYLEVDESVSAWRGVDGKCSDGMPHVTKIIRKPKGVGCEIKNIACALSKIMLRLEIGKGKAAERSKKFDGQYPVRDAPLPPPPRGIPPPRAPRAAARAEPPQPKTTITPTENHGISYEGQSHITTPRTQAQPFTTSFIPTYLEEVPDTK